MDANKCTCSFLYAEYETFSWTPLPYFATIICFIMQRLFTAPPLSESSPFENVEPFYASQYNNCQQQYACKDCEIKLTQNLFYHTSRKKIAVKKWCFNFVIHLGDHEEAHCLFFPQKVWENACKRKTNILKWHCSSKDYFTSDNFHFVAESSLYSDRCMHSACRTKMCIFWWISF